MPSTTAELYAPHIRLLESPPKVDSTSDTAGILAIADKHITKGLGRMKEHVFKEGKGLRVLTTVSVGWPKISRVPLTCRRTDDCSTSPLESESRRSDTLTPPLLRRSSRRLNRLFTSNAQSPCRSHTSSLWSSCCR